MVTHLLHGLGASLSGASKVGHIIGRKDCCPLSLLYRALLLYPFNSFFSSLRKRQSVHWAMSFCGLDVIIPASCRRRA
jgi:hypothetical protein